jgi:hypothetical protein
MVDASYFVDPRFSHETMAAESPRLRGGVHTVYLRIQMKLGIGWSFAIRFG